MQKLLRSNVIKIAYIVLLVLLALYTVAAAAVMAPLRMDTVGSTLYSACGFGLAASGEGDVSFVRVQKKYGAGQTVLVDFGGETYSREVVLGISTEDASELLRDPELSDELHEYTGEPLGRALFTIPLLYSILKPFANIFGSLFLLVVLAVAIYLPPLIKKYFEMRGISK